MTRLSLLPPPKLIPLSTYVKITVGVNKITFNIGSESNISSATNSPYSLSHLSAYFNNVQNTHFSDSGSDSSSDIDSIENPVENSIVNSIENIENDSNQSVNSDITHYTVGSDDSIDPFSTLFINVPPPGLYTDSSEVADNELPSAPHASPHGDLSSHINILSDDVSNNDEPEPDFISVSSVEIEQDIYENEDVDNNDEFVHTNSSHPTFSLTIISNNLNE